jgi:hypothetical protein
VNEFEREEEHSQDRTSDPIQRRGFDVGAESTTDHQEQAEQGETR